MAKIQKGNSIWYGPEVAGREENWIFQLIPEEMQELSEAACKFLKDSDAAFGHLPLEKLHLANFSLPLINRRIDEFLEALENGLGFVVWRGLPVTEWSQKKLAAAFLIIGSAMGNLRQQNAKGHVLGHVKDLGLSSSDPNVRVYQTRERQTFHTDSCDIVGLLSIQSAKEGGLSSLVSSGTVFNEMLKQAPELAEEMLKPFPMDRRGEVGPNDKPYFLIPVYHNHEGKLSAIYQRQYIDSSQRFPDAPKLTGKQIEALDLFDRLNDDPKLNFTMKLVPGDMQFVNNHALLHERTAFTDYPEEERKRHLLRIWIAPMQCRPLPAVYAQRFGSVEVGKRGGVNVPGVESVASFFPL